MDFLTQQLDKLTKKYNDKFIVFDKLTLPFRYFKKYNIIDNNILEKYIEPHFNPIMLLLSMPNQQIRDIIRREYDLWADLHYDTHFLDLKREVIELTEISFDNICKYFNNIPRHLLDKYQLKYEVFNNFDFYSKIIDKDDIDNCICKIEKDIDRTKNQYIHSKNYIIQELKEEEKYHINIDDFPDGDFILISKSRGECITYCMYIKKICKKIIKYSDINYSSLGKRKQMKKEDLKDEYLDGMKYRLFTTDLEYKYGYNNDNNITKWGITDDDKRIYLQFNPTYIDFNTY